MKIVKIKCECGYEKGFYYNDCLVCCRCNARPRQLCDPEPQNDIHAYGIIKCYCECGKARTLQLIYCTHDQCETRIAICINCKIVGSVNKTPMWVDKDYYEYKYILTTGLDLTFIEDLLDV